MSDSPDDTRTPDARIEVGSELQQLTGFLAAQREILLRKASGLSTADLSRTLAPSTLTLAGLISHAALNEDWWLTVRFAGQEPPAPWGAADWDANPDWEMAYGLTLEPDELRRTYLMACERSRAVVAAAAGPDALSVRARPGGSHVSLRWVLLHLVEETARHAGHADLIRESIDGETGE